MRLVWHSHGTNSPCQCSVDEAPEAFSCARGSSDQESSSEATLRERGHQRTRVSCHMSRRTGEVPEWVNGGWLVKGKPLCGLIAPFTRDYLVGINSIFILQHRCRVRFVSLPLWPHQIVREKICVRRGHCKGCCWQSRSTPLMTFIAQRSRLDMVHRTDVVERSGVPLPLCNPTQAKCDDVLAAR